MRRDLCRPMYRSSYTTAVIRRKFTSLFNLRYIKPNVPTSGKYKQTVFCVRVERVIKRRCCHAETQSPQLHLRLTLERSSPFMITSGIRLFDFILCFYVFVLAVICFLHAVFNCIALYALDVLVCLSVLRICKFFFIFLTILPDW